MLTATATLTPTPTVIATATATATSTATTYAKHPRALEVARARSVETSFESE